MKPKRPYYILRLTTFGLFVLSVILWILTIIGWFFTDPSYELLNVLVSSIISTILMAFTWLGTKAQNSNSNSYGEPGSANNEVIRLRYRKSVTDKANSIWIKDYLEKVLRKSEYIPLMATYRNDIVITSPSDVPKSEIIEDPENELLDDVLNKTVYSGRSLLVLGDTGAGKTTSALVILRQLLCTAASDGFSPIPLFLRLSTWKSPNKPLLDWIAEEAEKIYDIPVEITRNWIDTGEVGFLLDGIDEVERKIRGKCIEAINNFIEVYHPLIMVVTSRTAQYKALTTRLKVNQAVALQPYSTEQVYRFLSSGDNELQQIQSIISTDRNLQEFARNPLNLRLLTVLSKSDTFNLLHGGSHKIQRERLLCAFIESAVERRSLQKRYSAKKVLEQLAWIAYKMRAHRIPLIGIEQLQPSWLETEDSRHAYASLYRAVTQSIAGALFSLLVFGVGIWQLQWTNNPFIKIESPIHLILLVMLSAMFFGARRGMRQGEESWQRGEKERIRPVEVLKWSFESAAKGGAKSKTVKFPTRYIIPLGVGIGVVLGLAFANTPIDFIFWVLMATIMTIILIESASLVKRRHDMTTGIIERGLLVETKEDKEFPNEGIRLSARNAIIVTVGATLAVGIPIGIIRGIFLIPIWGINAGMALGIVRGLRDGAIAGLVAGGSFGGKTVIQHYSLRYILWRNKLIPLQLNEFLRILAEVGILKQLGGRYTFVYPLLFDYFARQGWRKYIISNNPNKVFMSIMYVTEPRRSRKSRINRRPR